MDFHVSIHKTLQKLKTSFQLKYVLPLLYHAISPSLNTPNLSRQASKAVSSRTKNTYQQKCWSWRTKMLIFIKVELVIDSKMRHKKKYINKKHKNMFVWMVSQETSTPSQCTLQSTTSWHLLPGEYLISKENARVYSTTNNESNQ